MKEFLLGTKDASRRQNGSGTVKSNTPLQDIVDFVAESTGSSDGSRLWLMRCHLHGKAQRLHYTSTLVLANTDWIPPSVREWVYISCPTGKCRVFRWWQGAAGEKGGIGLHHVNGAHRYHDRTGDNQLKRVVSS